MSNNQNLAHIQGLVLKCKYTLFFTYKVFDEEKYRKWSPNYRKFLFLPLREIYKSSRFFKTHDGLVFISIKTKRTIRNF